MQISRHFALFRGCGVQIFAFRLDFRIQRYITIVATRSADGDGGCFSVRTEMEWHNLYYLCLTAVKNQLRFSFAKP
jgi:hypothetical protein